MSWDAIVIGSGFGGTMAAHELVNAGLRVVMLERGGWVSRDANNAVGLLTPHYSKESPFDVRADNRRVRNGAWNCVGGQSVFYGGASYRLRERDFEAHPDLVGDSGAEWPYRYTDLEPFYAIAEQLLHVAGDARNEVTAPPRHSPYPQKPASLGPTARRVQEAALRMGLSPSRIPLAIRYGASARHPGCASCGKCDGYACPVEAKNDLATTIIPALIERGMTLRTDTVCVRLVRTGTRLRGVECVNRLTGERETILAKRVLLGAGSLATPHLLLASNLSVVSSAPHAIGRYLTRHRNEFVLGMHLRRTNPEGVFDKHVAIFDRYDTAGCIQQMTMPDALVRAALPWLVRAPASACLARGIGLLAIAEDQPRASNGVSIDWSHVDRFGLPRLHVHHHYTKRDEQAVRELVRLALRIQREAGALFSIVQPVKTFSHALGTVRMGPDPATSPLDEFGRFRGLDNLFVVDGSTMPRSGGVNPSLTIAANALRIGAHIARAEGAVTGAARTSRPARTLATL